MSQAAGSAKHQELHSMQVDTTELCRNTQKIYNSNGVSHFQWLPAQRNIFGIRKSSQIIHLPGADLLRAPATADFITETLLTSSESLLCTEIEATISICRSQHLPAISTVSQRGYRGKVGTPEKRCFGDWKTSCVWRQQEHQISRPSNNM